MPIKDYSEKKIRQQIIKKIKPKIKKGRSPHSKGYISIDGKIEAKVKIPNDHSRLMRNSKSQYIASALKLNNDEFNNLIDCPLKGPKYFELLRDRV